MPHAYPMMLDVADRLCVIIGGGAVAVRKARGLLAAGAKWVRVVAPQFSVELPPEVERVHAVYQPGHLDGAGLVFAATDVADVNAAVVRDAKRRGVLVSRADSDEDEQGDFVTPARYQNGPVVVAVSAGSAALAARVRDLIGRSFDPSWAKMAEAMQTLRPAIRGAAGLDGKRRAEIFRALATPEALRAAADGTPAVSAWLGERYPELKSLAAEPAK